MQNRGMQMKNSEERKEDSETEGEVEGWEVDRQITTKLRLADSCESRIWYCGTDTQTLAHTRAHMQAQTHAGVCVRVCACAHAQTQAHGGTYTCSHYPKEPHYTWNINGAKQSAKMEMGETEGRREGGDRKGEGKKERRMKAICLHYQSWSDMWAISKMICILNHHFYLELDQPTETTSSVVWFHRATNQGHSKC